MKGKLIITIDLDNCEPDETADLLRGLAANPGLLCMAQQNRAQIDLCVGNSAEGKPPRLVGQAEFVTFSRASVEQATGAN